MAKITVMSYKDTNAPQIVANNRTAFYGLLDVWLKDGYNQKFVKNLYTQPNRTIVLEYAAPHGYKTGHLIKITGATNTIFNKSFRCISVTSDTMTLRIDQTDNATYPSTDGSTSIQSVVAPADWQQIYTSSTQRTYRSKNTTQSSQLYYTFKEPTNTALKSAGACCYSCDISREFDVATGANLNSFFESQKTSTDGTNYYVVTDYYTTPLTNTGNGRAGTYLPWFLIASDTFVYFLLGNFVNTSAVYTDPNSFIDYRNWNRTGNYIRNQQYYFGDFIPYNTIEYTNKTSAVFSYYNFNTASPSLALNYFGIPERYVQETVDISHVQLVDSYIPQTQINPVSIKSFRNDVGGSCSGATTNYVPYPMINTTGFLTSEFQVYQQSNNTVNNPSTILRGYLPIFFFVLNYYSIPSNVAAVEWNPFVLEPSGSVYDELIMMSSSGQNEAPTVKISGSGFKWFRLD